MDKWYIVKLALKRVPALKYALAVAAMAILVGSVVGSFKIDVKVSIIGVLIMLILMVALFIFSKAVQSRDLKFEGPIYTLIWSFVLLTVLVPCLLVTSVFFKWPVDLQGWLKNKSSKEELISGDNSVIPPKTGLYRILILPFTNLNKQSSVDYAKIIQDRFINFNEKDSLDAEILYLNKFKYPNSWNQIERDSILKLYEADFLIWGDYAEEKSINLISLKYYSKRLPQYNKLDAELIPTSLVDFSKGKIQGRIDYLVYYSCGLINYQLLAKSNNQNIPLQNRYLRRAIKLISHCREIAPQNTSDYSWGILGTCYLVSDSIQKSISCFNSYLETFPNDIEARSNLAVCYVKLNKFQKAFSEINRAIKIAPDMALLYFQKATFSRINKDLFGAVRNYSLGLKIDSNDYNYIYYRAHAYSTIAKRLNRYSYYDSALIDLNRAIFLDPNVAKFYEMGCQINLDKKDYSQVVWNIDRIQNFRTLSYDDYYVRGMSHLFLRNLDFAERDLKIAIRMKPDDTSPYELLSTVYALDKRWSDAIDCCNRILTINPKNTNAIFNRAGALIEIHNFNAAERDLKTWKNLTHKMNDTLALRMENQIRLKSTK